jgi:two-component system chemotaxis response regulator CheY
MGKVILTVDDSASVRQMVRFTLADADYTVVEAVDGKDALVKLADAASSTPVNMVITDLNMPNLDGIGLIRSVRANPACKGIPIVMLTTESQESKKLEGKAAGATGWIVKPFTQQQMLAVVKRVIG